MRREFIYTGQLRGIGEISFQIRGANLLGVQFGKLPGKQIKNEKIESWLNRYLRGNPGSFPMGLEAEGTPFQQKVWNVLLSIPFGECRTYKWVAEKIGRPKAARAVGLACGANPLPLVIPCHRVVAKNGIGGFSSGLKIKKTLLRIEKIDL